MKKITKILATSLLSLALVLPLAACGDSDADNGEHNHVDTNGDGYCDSCYEPMNGTNPGGTTNPGGEQGGPNDPGGEQGGTTTPGGEKGEDGLLKENIIDDCYDNYYQIFPSSFCDSNGDRYGDLDGITSKLEYLRNMGYTGIWLTPINESDDYHGYNVLDYKSIHHKLGTFEDFDELIEKAHSLKIKVIIDLVINHSSENHPWFEEGVYDFRQGFGPCFDYYNFSSTAKSGYANYSGVYAEAYFGKNMPDLNLDSKGLRAEIKDIIEFWIKEKKVDGFRLDAALHFYGRDITRGAAFTKQVKEWADAAIKEARGDQNAEAFIVGEVWDNAGTVRSFFQQSGGANFFDFDTSTGGSNYVVNTVLYSTVSKSPSSAINTYFRSQSNVLSTAAGYIPCPFLDNHDVSRAANALLKDETNVKFAYGLLSLYSGNTFTYYGDEIGASGVKEGKGDCDVRVGMRWSPDTTFFAPGGSSTNDVSYFYPFPSVEEQLKDENSIINYYKRCNNARNAFPALMRGKTVSRVTNANSNVLVFTKSYQNEKITIAVNFSATQQTVTGLGNLTLKQDICVSGSASGNGASLKLPAYGIAILA